MKATIPPAEAYRRLRQESQSPIKVDRARIRELLRDIVDRIVVHFAEQYYEAYFNGGKEPFAVHLIKV